MAGSASAMIDDELLTGEAVALDVKPAGVFLRAAGAMIDVVLYLGGFIALALALSSMNLLIGDAALGQAVLIAALVVCLVIAPMTVETLSGGRSLGKLAIGARVVRDDGGGIRMRHAFVRALVGVVEVYLTLGGLALVVGFLNRRAKRLGDLLAGTYSQMERSPAAPVVSFSAPHELREWARTADVARLPDPLARRIGQFLSGAAQLTPESRLRLAETLARDTAPYVSPVPEVHPELLLAGVVAVRREREFTALELEQAHLRSLDPFLRALPHAFPDR